MWQCPINTGISVILANKLRFMTLGNGFAPWLKICGWPCRINILSQFDLRQLRMLQFLGRLRSFFDLQRFWFDLCRFCADELEVMQLSVVGPRVGLWIVLGRGRVGANSARPSKWRANFESSFPGLGQPNLSTHLNLFFSVISQRRPILCRKYRYFMCRRPP